ARGLRVVALVAGRKTSRHRRVLLEVGVGLAVGRGRAKQLHVDAPGLDDVDGRPRTLVDLHLLAAEEIAERDETVLHLAIHGEARGVEHERHLEVAQALLLRRPESQLPSRRLDVVGPGHDRQRQLEILAAARQRPYHVDVHWRALPWQGLTGARDDAPRGLVAE